MITGHTRLIAHIGWPTQSFKAPMIYNPWFDHAGVDVVVVPLGVPGPDFAGLLRPLFGATRNLVGALITMPHKVPTLDLVDEASPAARIAGACNAVKRLEDGRLVGDMFDGEGFVRGLRRKGCTLVGARALVVGAGGVGSAIAASLAGAGVAELGLVDTDAERASGLAARLAQHHPALRVGQVGADPAGYDIVVNATPLGMNEGDPLPVAVERIASTAFVGEVVMKAEMTAFLRAVAERGCRYQIGSDMLFEQIPAYLEFFGLPSTTAEQLRELATLRY